MALTFPTRTYLFSDTYGRSGGELHEDDPDAIILTDMRSFPLERVRRTFDLFGREGIAPHIVRLATEGQDALREGLRIPASERGACAATTTGIFVNAAPRVGRDNGTPFYVAEIGAVRVVTTSLAALSPVRDRIESLAHLPNDGSALYGAGEQFRSSYTPILLASGHGLPLVKDDASIVPEESDDWTLAYVDRFGNMVTRCLDPLTRWSGISPMGAAVKLTVGSITRTVTLGEHLATVEPGALSLYPNGNLDIVRKWKEGESATVRLEESAYMQFGRPRIGASITVTPA
jgi:hypothetical protein